MKKAEELERDINLLSSAEKHQLFSSLASSDDFYLLNQIYRSSQLFGIEKTPGICGGSARIIRTRIPLWIL